MRKIVTTEIEAIGLRETSQTQARCSLVCAVQLSKIIKFQNYDIKDAGFLLYTLSKFSTLCKRSCWVGSCSNRNAVGQIVKSKVRLATACLQNASNQVNSE